jgi:glutaredoxin-related protein
MVGGGFTDDVSPLQSYVVYGHGSLSKTEPTFRLDKEQNIIYLGAPGDCYSSIEATALWKFLTTIGDPPDIFGEEEYIRQMRIYLKLISGYIDDEVKMFKYRGAYSDKESRIFRDVRFHEGGSEVNNLDVYFTPLQRDDITSEEAIKDKHEVIKSGIYSVPIGFNYPIRNYCQNIGNEGSMTFEKYKQKHSEVKDLDDVNIFMKHSNDTYYCGLPADIGSRHTIEKHCKTTEDCNIAHDKLIDQEIKPYQFKTGIFINDEFKYKPIKLSDILNKFMKNDRGPIGGTYILPICRVGTPIEQTLTISQFVKERKPDIKFSIEFIKRIIFDMLIKLRDKYQHTDDKDKVYERFYQFVDKKIGRIENVEKLKASKFDILQTGDVNSTILKYGATIDGVLSRKDTDDKKIDHLTKVVVPLLKVVQSIT